MEQAFAEPEAQITGIPVSLNERLDLRRQRVMPKVDTLQFSADTKVDEMECYMRNRGGYHLLIIGVTAAFCTTCDSRSVETRRQINTSSDRVNVLFSQTRTVCFGRFIIEIPITATGVYGGADVNWPITRYRGEGNQLLEKVSAAQRNIEAQRHLIRGEVAAPSSMYGKVLDGGLPGQKLLFGEANNFTYRLYSYVTVGQDLFIQEALPLADKSEYSAAIQELNRVAQQLRPRADDEIPSGPGTCIDGAFVSDPAGIENERVTFGVRLAEFPDVHLSIEVTKKDKLIESDALERRIERAKENARRAGLDGWLSRIKVFREGARHIGNWSGFEILAWKPAQQGEGESHEFRFLSQGEPKNPLIPVLDIQLNTGVADNKVGARRPSVKDGEAMHIWDRLISTIRVRQAGYAKTVAVVQP